VPRETLSSHFDAQVCLGPTRRVVARARSSHDRSRSCLGRARTIWRAAQCPHQPARSICDQTQSAIC